MVGRDSDKDQNWEKRRRAYLQFRKFRGAGAGTRATDTLEAQRQQGASFEGLDKPQSDLVQLDP